MCREGVVEWETTAEGIAEAMPVGMCVRSVPMLSVTICTVCVRILLYFWRRVFSMTVVYLEPEFSKIQPERRSV